jgi:ADP-ribose pyrophosphatase
MPPKRWKTLSTRQVYQNPWMRLREDIAEMPNGKTTIYGGSNEVQRNIVAQTVLG